VWYNIIAGVKKDCRQVESEEKPLAYSIINDIIFKIVFAKDENKRILMALLNVILGYGGQDAIVEITIMNPSIDKETVKEKHSILDIKAVDGQGRHYNIEVQLKPAKDYITRTVYYLSGLFGDQLEAGGRYQNLAKTIGISITDFVLFDQTPDLHNVFRLANVKTSAELTDILELHYIELTKYDKDKPHKEMTKFEKWLYLLKFSKMYQDRLSPIPEALKTEEEIVMAIEAYRHAVADNYVKELIDFRRKASIDEASRIEEARRESKSEGKIEGKIEAAKIMLELGHTKTEIAAKLGLKETDF